MKTFVNALLLTVAASAAAISCQKDENAVPGEPFCRLSSVHFPDSLSVGITYDAQGRVARVTDYDSSREQVAEIYEYGQGVIRRRDSVPATATYPAQLASERIYELGANGFASVEYIINLQWGRDTTYYTYNNDGYLIKSDHRHYQIYNNNVLHLDYSKVNYYTIEGGNRVKDSLVFRSDNNNYQSVVTHTYSTAKSDYASLNFTGYDYPFLGKKNVSLLTMSTGWHSQFPGLSSMSYTYTLDAEGKPVSVQQTNANGTAVTGFKYQCR